MLYYLPVIMQTLCVGAVVPPPRQSVMVAVRDTGNFSVAAWRDWFAHRRFALDPWFFLATRDAAATRCPGNVRLSLAAVDSQGITLTLVDDTRTPPVIRTRCSIAYTRLAARPEQGILKDGRVLWRLRTAPTEQPRSQ